jgi:hypothetical protein
MVRVRAPTSSRLPSASWRITTGAGMSFDVGGFIVRGVALAA